MTVDDLKKSVSDMSDDELLELLEEIRRNRRNIPKKKQVKKKEKDLLKGITKEQAKLILDMIEQKGE